MVKLIEILSVVIFSGIMFSILYGLCFGSCTQAGLVFRGIISIAFVTIVWMKWVKRIESD